jgi:Transcriptional regulator containing PAS, AAA-type ATPase, and DNA-binding domains
MYTENDIALFTRNAMESLYLTIIIDKECKILYIGQKYAGILGFSQKDLIGADIRAVIPGTKLPYVLETKKPIHAELFELNNGELVVCNRLPIFDDENNVIGVISLSSFDNLNLIDKLNTELAVLKSKNRMYQKQLESLKSLPGSGKEIIGESVVINQLRITIKQVAPMNIPILITGETGVGKEVFANAIHMASDRRENNYIKINCAAIPKELLESELFGYVEGAFSGASKNGKSGKFELANHGTLLLDEIGEMPMELQAKLLRVLQEKEIEKVGGTKPIPIDVRIICSTNQNMEKLISEGKFRKDLYYRINTVEMEIPPLRDREDDMLLLCEHFIEKFNKIHGCQISYIEGKAIELFQTYDWPGNIRQLEHVIERACVTTFTGKLDTNAFRFFLDTIPLEKVGEGYEQSFQEQKQETEKNLILNTLAKTKGNKTEAAKILHISRSLLYKKIDKYDLKD